MAQKIDTADLFGSDSEDDEREQQGDQDISKKARLEALVNKKRKEADEEREQAKNRISKRARAAAEDDEGVEEDEEAGLELEDEAAAPAIQPAGEENEEEREQLETAADTAFIDDEGADEDAGMPWAGGDDEDDERGVPEEAEEAEEGEEDEIDRALTQKGRRRKNKFDDAHLGEFIEEFLSRMEAAKDVDNENNINGQPALEKLKLLPEVEDILARTFMHRQFLDAGLMGAIRDWLYPLPDGSLPNIRLRTSLLRILDTLPIDTHHEHRKEQLKRSKLGEMVMFYYKLSDETVPNRKMAKALVEKWSKPIFDSYKPLQGEQHEGDVQRMAAQRRERQARQRDEEQVQAEEWAGKANLKPGDTGFRWHARIPRASQLDYVKRPDMDPSLQAEARGGGGGGGGGKKSGAGKQARLTKKLKDLGSKGKKAAGRAAHVSVEGRGLLS